jgi:O-antigen/teichoic acid export membrane protein
LEKRNYSNKIISSFGWVFLERLIYSAIVLINTVVLARLLSPVDFGVVGSVIVIISISNMIIEGGWGGSLVQKSEPSDTDYNTVFTFNLTLSVIFYILVFISAPFISEYLGAPELKMIIRVLSLTILFNSLIIVHKALLVKNLQFKLQTKISIVSLLASSVLSISAALLKFGVFSIVIQFVSFSFFNMIFTLWKMHVTLKMQFCRHSFLALIGFGGRVILSSLLKVAYYDLIVTVISRVYSSNLAGLYIQSDRIISFPLNIFRSVVDGAAFPLLSRIENKSFMITASNMNRLVFNVAFPLLLVITFNSRASVLLVLGAKWIEAAELLSFLSIAIVFLVMEISFMNIFKSMGLSKAILRLSILRSVLGLIGLTIAVQYTLKWVLISLIVTNFITVLTCMYSLQRSTCYSFFWQLKDLCSPLILGFGTNILAHIITTYFLFSPTVIFFLHIGIVLVLWYVLMRTIFIRELEFLKIFNQIK